jgi:hypothetical protein
MLGKGRLLASGTVGELLGTFERAPVATSRLEKIYLERLHALS